jgi:hypothetical protein
VGARLTIRVTKDGMIGVVKDAHRPEAQPPSLKTAALPGA